MIRVSLAGMLIGFVIMMIGAVNQAQTSWGDSLMSIGLLLLFIAFVGLVFTVLRRLFSAISQALSSPTPYKTHSKIESGKALINPIKSSDEKLNRHP